MELTYLFCALFVISAGFNAYLFIQIKIAPKPQSDYDARMLLHDLTAGSGLVRVQRVAPEDVLLRSPRGAL